MKSINGMENKYNITPHSHTTFFEADKISVNHKMTDNLLDMLLKSVRYQNTVLYLVLHTIMTRL